MKLLLLGGTSDAIKLCQQFLREGYDVIYSIKGLVRQPQLSCEIHSGGFGGVKGLNHYLQQKSIDCLIDATHPYAVNISHNASLAAQQSKTPCFHYVRPSWQKHSDDIWIGYQSSQQLITLLSSNDYGLSRPFFTIGQLPAELLATKNTQHHYTIRTAIAQKRVLDKVTWIKNIGPFTLEKEQQLFKAYAIDALVSKNSGGVSVAAKIQVAREMKIPVFMLQRPELKTGYPIFDHQDKLLKAVLENL